MNHGNRIQQWLSIKRLDVTLAKIGVVVCLLLLGLRLLTTQVLLVIIPTAAGAACVLYLGVQRQRSMGFVFPTLPRGVIGYLPSVVFFGLAGLVLLTYLAGRRTPPIYLLTGLIGSLIFVQTLLITDDDLAAGLVLSQIVTAALVVRFSALLVTPGVIGVDIWTHVPVFIAGIVEAESLSAIADSKYIMAPLYHTLGAVGAILFGSARMGVYLTTGLLMPLSVLFVYATGRLLLPVRWALTATALYAFADHFIDWGIHVIPTSLGLVFFLGALYCVTRLFYTTEPWALGFLIVFSLATVFTHQVSTAIVLVLLGTASAAAVLLTRLGWQRRGDATLRVLGIVGTFVSTLVVTIVSWMYTPWYADDPFLWQMLDTLQGTLFGEAGFLNLAGGGGDGNGAVVAAESGGLVAEAVPFIEWFGFALLLLAAVVGGLAMLRTDEPPEVTVTYIFASATMFVVIFGFSLFGIRDILPGRWLGFMYALFAIMGALGLYYLAENASRRVILVVFIIIALGYPTTMVVAEKATMDSPAFESEYPRVSFTDSEIAAVETIRDVYPPNADRRVFTDHPYQSVFGRYGGYPSRVVELDESGLTIPNPVVTRDYQTQGATLFYEAGEPQRSISSRTVSPERVCAPQRNQVYSNGDVRMCTSPATTAGGGS